MSRGYASSTQELDRTPIETLSSEVAGQSMAGSDGTATEIRPLHVFILGGLSIVGPLSMDMYLPSLPSIGRELGATASQTQLSLSVFLLGLALGPVIIGPLSDALGRRRPLLVGAAAFALTSLLCIFAPSIGVLTVLRFIEGVAGAAGMVIGLAFVRDVYTGVAQARFFSLLMLVTSIGPIIAPVVGSLLLTVTSWRGIFVVLTLVGVLLFCAVVFGLGETLPPRQRLSGGVSASLVAFRDLLANRPFVGYALSCGFAFAACIVYYADSPFVLQNIYGVPPQRFGLLFGINALGIFTMSQVNGRLVGRVSPQKLLMWGVAALAITGVCLLVVVASGIGLVGLLVSFFAMTASLGLIIPNSATLALSTTRTAGSASALLGLLQLAIGSVLAPLVGVNGSTNAVPMAAVIAALGVAAPVTLLVLCRPRGGREQAERVERAA